MQLRRWLLRKRIKHILLTSIFTLTLTVSVVLGSAFPTYTQTPTSTSTSRESLIKEIKGYAERHVANDSQIKTEFVVQLYKDNSVGLAAPEIAQIYENEYTRLKKEKTKNRWERFPQAVGWLTAAILAILLIFRDVLHKWIGNAIKTAGNWLYNRLVGSPLLLGIALKRYQKALIEKHQKLYIPFRPNRPLDMREVWVSK